ncbi:MAG: heavy metal-responsive transcriptional regulator [Acidimicrobiia bacterium]|mgnify:CR=1 FL=1|jgi:DNA-binding transcriptional MerR regulator|nr:heavy metal-responsive transcriptional regulator [Acidimicrobiia bacterium]
MLIGQLAARSGVPARTIRFYEERGILPEPSRTDSGYREYAESDVHRLRFLRAAQDAGLTLAEIRSVFAIRARGEAPCEHTLALLEAKRSEVTDRLESLEALQEELGRLIQRGRVIMPTSCDADAVCSIISP